MLGYHKLKSKQLINYSMYMLILSFNYNGFHNIKNFCSEHLICQNKQMPYYRYNDTRMSLGEKDIFTAAANWL